MKPRLFFLLMALLTVPTAWAVVTDEYTKGNLKQLKWSADAKSFRPNKETKCYVSPDHALSEWERNFPDVNVTFVNDGMPHIIRMIPKKSEEVDNK